MAWPSPRRTPSIRESSDASSYCTSLDLTGSTGQALLLTCYLLLRKDLAPGFKAALYHGQGVGQTEPHPLIIGRDPPSAWAGGGKPGEAMDEQTAPILLCPCCNEALLPDGRGLRCAQGHAFDRAREGYVNLLRTRDTGDAKVMLQARRQFLDQGHYAPLAEALSQTVIACLSP